MPLIPSLPSFKRLGLLNNKAKRGLRNPRDSRGIREAQVEYARARWQELQDLKLAVERAQQEYVPLERERYYGQLHNLDNIGELLKRIQVVYYDYAPLTLDHRPIVFNAERCEGALDLRPMLSLERDSMLDNGPFPIFQLHVMGIRLPPDPLSAHPPGDYGDEVRKVFRQEFGYVFVNISLEILGLVTVLHVIGKTTAWLRPLVRSSRVNVICRSIGTSQPVPAYSRPEVSQGISGVKLNADALGQQDAMDPDKTPTQTRPPQTRPQSSAMALRADFAAFRNKTKANLKSLTQSNIPQQINYRKEGPDAGLDRWVLGERSYGHEPTLSDCITKLHGLKQIYEQSKEEAGVAPSPVNTKFGFVDHALYLHRFGENAPRSNELGDKFEPQTVPHLKAARLERQQSAQTAAWRAMTSTSPKLRTAQTYTGSAQIPALQAMSVTNPMSEASSQYPQDARQNSPASTDIVPKTPAGAGETSAAISSTVKAIKNQNRYLPLTGSPIKSKKPSVSPLRRKPGVRDLSKSRSEDKEKSNTVAKEIDIPKTFDRPPGIQHSASAHGIIDHDEIAAIIKEANENFNRLKYRQPNQESFPDVASLSQRTSVKSASIKRHSDTYPESQTELGVGSPTPRGRAKRAMSFHPGKSTSTIALSEASSHNKRHELFGPLLTKSKTSVNSSLRSSYPTASILTEDTLEHAYLDADYPETEENIDPQDITALLTDQEARVETILTQLYLMEDVFKKALDAMAATVAPAITVEKVTDLAVAYGWFKPRSMDLKEGSCL